MHTLHGFTLTILLVACTSGCSQHAPGADATASAQASAAVASAPAAASVGPSDNPCALLTDAEVRAVFPKAEAGKRNTDGLQYGLDRCAWETPTGQVGVEVSRIEAGALESELRGQLTGAVDPQIQGAAEQIRLQTIAGIGDNAIAVLEQADAQRGILTDIALIAIQRGRRMAVLVAHDASTRAPPPSLDSLEDLGRKLAQRL